MAASARKILNKLLEDFAGDRRYWDRYDCLNSDGRRLLHRVAKEIIDDVPALRRLVAEARRNPCVDTIRKLLERLEESIKGE